MDNESKELIERAIGSVERATESIKRANETIEGAHGTGERATESVEKAIKVIKGSMGQTSQDPGKDYGESCKKASLNKHLPQKGEESSSRFEKLINNAEKKIAKNVLLGRIVSDKFFGPGFVKTTMKRVWRCTNDFEVTSKGHNIFCFKFGNEADKKAVAEGVPWYIANNHFVIKEWLPHLSREQVDLGKSCCWIQVHGLPLEQTNKECAEMIGEAFAGLLDLAISVEKRPWVRFKYEELPELCWFYGRMGHAYSRCPHRGVNDRLPVYDIPEKGYGHWLKAEVCLEKYSEPAGIEQVGNESESTHTAGQHHEHAQVGPLEASEAPIQISNAAPLETICAESGTNILSPTSACGPAIKKSKGELGSVPVPHGQLSTELGVGSSQCSTQLEFVGLSFEEAIEMREIPVIGSPPRQKWKNKARAQVQTCPQPTEEVQDNGLQCWFLTLVYAPPKRQERRLFWEVLRGLQPPLGEPWILIGDFNAVFQIHEKEGDRISSLSQHSDFADML
ncbi:hypothetical protein Tsubulata_036922 [Turnera subulata]|uniref:DUF4283 domain-containing protein n=1 Tax=Turnera subulata TaxID=218843 RepID=A0A9Q0JDP1_9ROSI|nr:hypothetical protein Tsubulata_036922 [Turnera subulata]